MNTEASETLPRADDAERYVLGCLVAFPERAGEMFATQLRALDFVDPLHQRIFQAFADQHARGAVDPVLVGKQTDPGYLLILGSDITTSVHVPSEAAKIVDARRKRQLFEFSESLREAALNGQPADDVFRLHAADLDDYRREAIAERPSFTAISASEFASTAYELNYLIPGLLVEGQPGIVAAPKKGMKTSLLMDYAIAQAQGGKFLGYFPVETPRRVLFCSGESGLATLQETAQRQCVAAGYSLADIQNLIISTDLPKCGSAINLQDFGKFIADVGAEIVITDPAYLCFPAADAGNLFAQGELLRGLNDIIAEQLATLLLAHHTRKLVADPYGQPELENIAWAGFQEYARQWWLLGRREAYEPGSGIHRLWLSVGGSAGHGNLFAVDIDEGTYDTIGGRYWRVNVQKAAEARTAAQQRKSEAQAAIASQQLEADRAAICRVLAKHADGATKTFIREHCGVSGRRFPIVFASLVDDGELVDCEVQVSNHKTPRPGFKLAPSKSS